MPPMGSVRQGVDEFQLVFRHVARVCPVPKNECVLSLRVDTLDRENAADSHRSPGSYSLTPAHPVAHLKLVHFRTSVAQILDGYDCSVSFGRRLALFMM